MRQSVIAQFAYVALRAGMNTSEELAGEQLADHDVRGSYIHRLVILRFHASPAPDNVDDSPSPSDVADASPLGTAAIIDSVGLGGFFRFPGCIALLPRAEPMLGAREDGYARPAHAGALGTGLSCHREP